MNPYWAEAIIKNNIMKNIITISMLYCTLAFSTIRTGNKTAEQ